jgi:hypothetical protein
VRVARYRLPAPSAPATVAFSRMSWLRLEIEEHCADACAERCACHCCGGQGKAFCIPVHVVGGDWEGDARELLGMRRRLDLVRAAGFESENGSGVGGGEEERKEE